MGYGNYSSINATTKPVKMKYTALLIDDEEMACRLLQGMLAQYCPQVDVVGICHDLPSGVKAIRKFKPDIVFLDIEMPGHSGLELLDFFDENEVDFSVVFVTAYNRYAIQAFKLSAVDYLLKPIDSEDLVRAVELVHKQRNKQSLPILRDNLHTQNKKIGLNTVSAITFVDLNDILFFQADGSYTKVVFTDNRSLITSKSLKHYEHTLAESSQFYRCHKSYIVNLQHIHQYVKSEGGYLKVGTHAIGVSPDKVNYLLEKLSL